MPGVLMVFRYHPELQTAKVWDKTIGLGINDHTAAAEP